MKTKAIMPVLLMLSMVWLTALLALTAGLLYNPSASYAADCPQFTSLGGFSDGAFEPVRVAVSNSGDAYVTDWFNGKLRVFDHKGGLLRALTIDPSNHEGLDNTGPTSVGVDDVTGNIYVGRADDRSGIYTGEVIIFNSNLSAIGRLGRGYGEFQYPSAIAIDAERVYVTDSENSLVKVFDKSGEFLFSFGGHNAPQSGGSIIVNGWRVWPDDYGYQPGYLVRPIGVAVHPVTGDIYVADRALYCPADQNLASGTCVSYFAKSGSEDATTEQGTKQSTSGYYDKWAMGTGVHVFRLSADKRSVVFQSRFGRFGNGQTAGNIYNPGGIAVSGERVIVSDSKYGGLHVFDTADGAALCMQNTGAKTKGLAVGADGRLLGASEGRMVVFGLDNYVQMTVEPNPLVVDSSQCTSQAIPVALTVNNGGPGTLNWEISEDIPWLIPSSVAGFVAGLGAVDVPVQIDLSSQDLMNLYEGELIVRAQGELERVAVKVRLSIPVLTVTPDVVYFNMDGVTAPQPKSLNIKLSTDTADSLRWTASSDSSWLTISPSEGPSGALALANISIDTMRLADLGGSDHIGYITVSAGCATGSPVIIPVKVTGQVAQGTLRVTTNIPAPITITGSSTVTGNTSSSAPYTYSAGLPAGSYTVSFGAVSGFKAPAPQTVGITGGGLGEAVGNYIDLREKLNIISTMGSGQWYVADELKVFDGTGSLKTSLALASATRTRTGTRDGRAAASGDVDGDGIDDIIVATDRGAISGIKADGTPISGLNFTAFSYDTSVSLAVADIDGDGKGEIIVGAGAKAGNTAALRVFYYAGGKVLDTGINVVAHEELYGVKAAVGDVDGDGKVEIATVPGGGGSASVRMWDVDVSGGKGGYKLTDAGAIQAGSSPVGPAIAAADVDADGVDEIVIARGAVPASGSATIAAFKSGGSKALEFTIDAAGPLSMAAGDMDMDGVADIVVGENAAQSPSTVRVYKNGVLGKEFPAFNSGDITGVRVSLGRVGGDR